MSENKNTFSVLNAINVNQHTEKKQNLTYLSWAWAWAEAKKNYPDAAYTVDYYDGKPYLYDENLGYMVSTTVTINGETLPMHLPVMDGANKAMKTMPYKYTNRYKQEKTCEAATMFDINKTIMRCLVKNLAMFGLGLYIYAGEDLPETPITTIKDAFADVLNTTNIKATWDKYPQFHNDESFKVACKNREKQLKDGKN